MFGFCIVDFFIFQYLYYFLIWNFNDKYFLFQLFEYYEYGKDVDLFFFNFFFESIVVIYFILIIGIEVKGIQFFIFSDVGKDEFVCFVVECKVVVFCD